MEKGRLKLFNVFNHPAIMSSKLARRLFIIISGRKLIESIDFSPLRGSVILWNPA
jgi:hypothetical protein